MEIKKAFTIFKTAVILASFLLKESVFYDSVLILLGLNCAYYIGYLLLKGEYNFPGVMIMLILLQILAFFIILSKENYEAYIALTLFLVYEDKFKKNEDKAI